MKGGVYRLLPPLDECDRDGMGEGAALDAWIRDALGAGILGKREAGIGM